MQKSIVVKSTVGLHASLAAKVVQAASKYSVDINLIYKDKTIDVKSILGLMSLAIPSGENVIIEADGAQAEAAIADIEKVLTK
jgi:phosphocarrier protein